MLPRTHGSALFTRGETQALAVTTLGALNEYQALDGISLEAEKHFMLHYNFPALPPRLLPAAVTSRRKIHSSPSKSISFSSKKPCMPSALTSNAASTTHFAAPVLTARASARPPSSMPSAPSMILLPAPVSPVITVKPGSTLMSSRSIRA